MVEKAHSDEDAVRLRTIIGPRLKEARLAAKLTQVGAAKAIGITAEFFARMERGHALPSVPTINSIAQALNVTVDYLIGHDTPLPPRKPSKKTKRQSRQITDIVDTCRDDPELRRIVMAVLKLCARGQPPDDDDDG